AGRSARGRGLCTPGLGGRRSAAGRAGSSDLIRDWSPGPLPCSLSRAATHDVPLHELESANYASVNLARARNTPMLTLRSRPRRTCPREGGEIGPAPCYGSAPWNRGPTWII